eukprot:TRINITY_DN4443_c0_g1_i4.p1 TRINITY_DN4443_c0_g1~~TRINITY_DN4443_c0_g1_i4.p1  ORF type:complete len:433 (-),score=117.64 TRINITY_DN4443_c0_g1_i4:160-1458(-)
MCIRDRNVVRSTSFCDAVNSVVLPFNGLSEDTYTISDSTALEIADTDPDTLAMVTVTSTAPRTVQISGKFLIEQSTKQLLMFVVCGSEETVFKADLSFYNTYGYIPGAKAGFVAVYFILMLVTIVSLLVFSGLCIRQYLKAQLLVLQGIIAGLQLLSAVEAIAWFAFLMHLNDSGHPMCCPLSGPGHLVIGLTVVKHVLSRALLTLVCLGFGVVRQTISRKELALLLCLCGMYLLFSYLDEISDADSIGSGGHRVLWLAITFMCDFTFVWWIITSLKKTMDELEEKRQSEKFQMYRNMNRAITVFIVIWIVYGAMLMGFTATGSLGHSASASMLGSLGPAIYFCLLLTISVIWRPTARSHMLAMSFELCQEEVAPDIELSSGIEHAEQPEGGAMSEIQLTPRIQVVKSDPEDVSPVASKEDQDQDSLEHSKL